jgi:hypothetical protein
VAELADREAVRVRRRDGAALLLTREDRVQSAAEGAVAAARALRGLATHVTAATVATSLAEEFPWMDVLPAEDRAEFVGDFLHAFRVSAELGQWSTLAQVLREWKATAAIHADPELAAALSRPLGDDLGSVPTPGAE